MNIIKRSLPKRIVARLSRHPIAVVSVISLGVKVGADGFKFKKGELDDVELRRRMGGHFGNMGGGLAGAAAGAAAGSVLLPGLGLILGGFAGGMLGEDLGGKAGRKVVVKAEQLLGVDAPPDPTVEKPTKKNL